MLAAAGVLQTIPSLALLLFMIPADDVARGKGDRRTARDRGAVPLQPAADRPEHARRADGHSRLAPRVGGGARAAAASRPCGGSSCRWRPPTILAGVRTAAVINVGTATLGGFIGAGGYGRPILRGIDKFDVPLMLEGAIPAALLALAIEGLFGLIERAVPRRD